MPNRAIKAILIAVLMASIAVAIDGRQVCPLLSHLGYCSQPQDKLDKTFAPDAVPGEGSFTLYLPTASFCDFSGLQ